jgi:hypothetical protein
MMDAEERDIFYYLRGEKDVFVSLSAICRHAAGRHLYQHSPDWARPVLARMEERGIVESDAGGAYRLRPRPEESFPTQRWVSPQIAAIFRKSGKSFQTTAPFEDEEAYYNSL